MTDPSPPAPTLTPVWGVLWKGTKVTVADDHVPYSVQALAQRDMPALQQMKPFPVAFLTGITDEFMAILRAGEDTSVPARDTPGARFAVCGYVELTEEVPKPWFETQIKRYEEQVLHAMEASGSTSALMHTVGDPDAPLRAVGICRTWKEVEAKRKRDEEEDEAEEAERCKCTRTEEPEVVDQCAPGTQFL